VCLQNIDRCRPFFLCFLGQRYGWIPGAGDVSAETLARYPGLKAAIVEQRSVTELEVLHAVVAPFVGGEAKLAADQSFFYLRQPDFLADMPAEPAQLKRIYSDEAEEEAQSRAFLVDRQNRLREVVSGQKQRPARQYSARWSNARRTPELSMPLDCPATLRENQDRWRRDWQRSGEVSIPEGALSVPAAQAERARAYNQRLCAGRLGDFWSDGRSLTDVIVDDLKAAILERYPERGTLPEQDDLSREIDRHEDFVRTAADVFIERPGDFAELDAYAAGDSQNLFALVAKAGLGKSTLLANWVARWRSRDGKPADETMHARFVGVGERSNNVDSLLRSILEELRRAGKLSSEIPDNPNVLRSKLAGLLGECGEKGRTIVVIDALNQLQSGLTDLDWVAHTLPDGKRALSGGNDHTLKLWDLDTGQCLRTFTGHTDIVRAVTLLPDGKRALSASGNALKLWDLDSGQCRHEPREHSNRVNAVAFSTDGKRALSGSSDGTLKLWDPVSGHCLRTLQGHKREVFAIAISHCGQRVLSGSWDNTLKLWNFETGQCLRTLDEHTDQVRAVALLPDGKRALSGSVDSTIKLWNLDTGQCLRTLQEHTSWVGEVAILPDGKRALSGSGDKTLRLWDLDTGQCLRTLPRPSPCLAFLALLPDGRRALSATRGTVSDQQSLNLWDLDTGQCLLTLDGRFPAALSPDGKRAVSAHSDNDNDEIKVWDMETGTCLRVLEGQFPVSFLPNGKRAVSSGGRTSLRLWEIETGLCLVTWPATLSVRCSAARADVFFVGTDDGEVLFLKLMPPGRIVPEVIAATWHPSRPLLAVARVDGTILLQAWHPESQHLEELARTTFPPITSLQWSTDGAHLLATTKDGTRRVFDGVTLAQIVPAPAGDLAKARTVSPNGRWRAVIREGQLVVEPVN